MENIRPVIVVVFSVIVVFQNACVLSCPVNCKCRGKASICGSGYFSTFPTGLDASTEYLGVSGSESQPNNITSIQPADFQGTRSLFSLAITFSGVRRVEDDAFSFLHNLHILNLANNDIRNMSANSFKGLTKLVFLDLSGNKNSGLSKSLFTYIGSVEDLNLGDMNLKVLESDLFDYVPELKKLRLYTNGLKKLPTDVISPLLHLEFLDISSNELTGLQSELKPTFTKLGQLNLAENPWQCNCQMQWLRGLPASMKISVTDLKDIICHGPDNLKYFSFNNIADSMLRCIPFKIRNCGNANHSIEENKLISLPCVFEGDPSPEIKWTRPDGHEIVGRETIAGNYEIFRNGTLLIHHVTANDNGDWTVSAYNKTTHVDKRIKINVILHSTSTVQPASTKSKPTVSRLTAAMKSATSRSSANTSSANTSSANTSSAHVSATTPRPKSGSSSLSCTAHGKIILYMFFIFVMTLIKRM